VHAVRLPCRELERSHVPERSGVIRAEKNISYVWLYVAVLQPANLDYPPQFANEPKPFRSLRFGRDS